MRIRGNDRGALGVPGMLKIAVALGVLGVLGYDGFVTVATHLKAENDAQNAAFAASQTLENAADDGNRSDPVVAYEGALTWLAENQPSKCTDELRTQAERGVPAAIPRGCDFLCTGSDDQQVLCNTHGLFNVDPDGTVHLVVRREANTLVFSHLGFMHRFLVAYEQGDAKQGA
jgi:hypothetical protein